MPPLLAPLSLLLILFLAGNAFGIRRRQGRAYVSAFETTHPHGASQLAALKVLVKSACVLAAIGAIGISVWISMPILGDAVFIQMWNVPLSSRLTALDGVVAALSGYQRFALMVVVAIGLVVWVAAFAVISALWVRYARRANIAALSLLLFGIALALLALAEQKRIVSPFLLDAALAAARWVFLAAMVLTTVYVLRRGFAERVLTIRYACGALVVLAAFGAAWLTLLAATGAQPAVPMLWLLLLAVMTSVLAPWSLSRVRHT